MSFGYVTIDGERVEAHVAARFQQMAAQFLADTGYSLHVSSGTRTRAEQEYLYNGWINRLPGFNLAAPPGQSNHEESGPSGPRSLDLYDSAPFSGVTVRGTAHDIWMQNNAHRWEFENEGYNFNPVEAWHKTFRGVIEGTTTGGGSSIPIDAKVLAEQQFLNAARGEALVPDGQKGAATTAAYERYQVFLRDNYGYTGPIDGDWGDGTQAAHALYYAAWVGSQYPRFPLPAGSYFGPEAGGDQSISGWHSYNAELKQWQQRMVDRGWTLTVDGLYGPMGATTPQGETYQVALAFQQEKGFEPDGLIGPQTWDGAWTAPITPPPGTPDPPAIPVPEVPANPRTPDNPRGLATVTPHYPGAFIGLEAPLGDGPRGFKGEDNTPVPYIIDQFHIHRTGTNGDDGDWFSYKNSRSSCPHLHIMSDARVRQFIRPKMKPCLTGPEWNWRGYGIEIQGAGDGSAAQFEVVADIMAWLASYEGKELDGVPVTYNLRTRAGTTLTHREMLPGTECPGDWWQDHVDALINRARTILVEKYMPPAPGSTVTVERAFLENLRAELTASADAIGEVLET